MKVRVIVSFWFSSLNYGAADTPIAQWTHAPSNGCADQFGWSSWQEINRAFHNRQQKSQIPAVPSNFSLTLREIGYCPGSHLDIFDFGSSDRGRGGLFMNLLSYLILPDLISAKHTGFWYSTLPLNLNAGSGDGYCPMVFSTFTKEHRYVSAELSLQSSYGGVPSSAITHASNTLVDWFNEITKNHTESPPTLRTEGADGLPVQRVILMSAHGVPSLSDQSPTRTYTVCENTYCLTHVNSTYTNILEKNCTRRVSARSDLRVLEDKLNDYICPKLKNYKNIILEGSNLKGIVGLNGLDRQTVQNVIRSVRLVEQTQANLSSSTEAENTDQYLLSDYLDTMTNILNELNEAGYTLTGLGEGSDYCPVPDPPTWEQVREVLEYIKPDWLTIRNTDYNGIAQAEPEWIEGMNAFLSVFDGIVPVQRRFMRLDEYVLYSIVPFFNTIPCPFNVTRSSTGPPTLAPDDPGTCLIGDLLIPAHDSLTPEEDSEEWRRACTRHRSSINYGAVMAGTLTGSVLTTLLWQCCKCLDTADEHDSKDLGTYTKEAVLFAH